MPSFDFTPTPGANPLAAYYAAGASQAANATTQQDLADRATLRGLAPGLAANDPDANATALTLGAPGIAASAGLSGMHADQRAQLGQTLGVTSQISGAILAAPPEQRAALWAQYQPMMVKAGATNTPVDYPGDDAVNAHRVAALSTQDQITALGSVPTANPYQTPLSLPPGPHVGPGGAIVRTARPSDDAGGAGSPAPADPGFTPALGSAETGNNPGAVNAGGYSGNFQFGKGRLADPGVGVYTPAPGESLAPADNGKPWQGTFNIPGYPDVKTHAQFLASSDAQKAVFATHVADIDRAIAQTPGAADMNQNGLRAVAHLGGVAGMQRFVSSGGLYDPGDAPGTPGGGTHLSDYYKQFSAGGPRALQASFGHPAGPLPPAGAAPSGAPALAPVQVAGPGAPTGTPPATAPAASAPAPAISNPNDLLSLVPPGLASAPRTNQFTPAASAQPPAPPPVGASPAASAPQPQLMPSASAQPPAGVPAAPPRQPTVAPPRALAPGETPLYLHGAPMPGRSPGYQMTRLPDGSWSQIRMPGTPPNIEYQKTEDAIVGIDKDTNTVVSRVPITSAARALPVPAIDPVTGKAGIQSTQLGQPVGPVYPGTGAEAQAVAYNSDREDMKASKQAAAISQANMPRLNEMADLIPQVATGGLAPEMRAKLSGILEGTFGYTPGKVGEFFGLSNAEQAQLLLKLTVSTAQGAAKDNTGTNTGIQSTQLSLAANPGMHLVPGANLKVTNMMRVQNQATQDYNQAAQQQFKQQEHSHLHGGQYEAMTDFDQQWQAQANPQVYAGATAILNGDKYDDWSARLKGPAEIQRAQQIAQRVDPNITVPQPGQGPINRLSERPASGSAASVKQAVPPTPAIGTVMQGHSFLGGDPSSPASWRSLAPPAASPAPPQVPIN